MQNEFISQYAHTWRVFTRLVNDFDDESWLHTGRDATTPARLSFHILKSTKYYLGDLSEMKFISGKSFEMNGQTAVEDELPSRDDILQGIVEHGSKNY